MSPYRPFKQAGHCLLLPWDPAQKQLAATLATLPRDCRGSRTLKLSQQEGTTCQRGQRTAMLHWELPGCRTSSSAVFSGPQDHHSLSPCFELVRKGHASETQHATQAGFKRYQQVAHPATSLSITLDIKIKMLAGPIPCRGWWPPMLASRGCPRP